MKCTSFHNRSVMILCALLSCYAVLYLIDNFYDTKYFSQQEYSQSIASPSENIVGEENLLSNDFSLTHENGKDENMQHNFVYTLQGDKLLRECIFDRDKILILTQKLIWFTHSAYQLSLPPLWHPSIPIAHRRLII